MKQFEEIEIWQLARDLSKDIFKYTTQNEFEKDYRFKSQIRAAIGSVMDNIAEGHEREGNKEYLQFLYIAKGSAGEVRSQIYRAFDYHYINKDEFQSTNEKLLTLSKKIASYIHSIRNSDKKGTKYKPLEP
jgi:four helix bundle protein